MGNRDVSMLALGLGGGALSMVVGVVIGYNLHGGAGKPAPKAPTPSPVIVAAPAPAPMPPPPPSPVPAAVVEPDPAVTATPRDLGTPPWRVDRVHLWEWNNRPDFALRNDTRVTRLRELPAGTELRAKMSCRIGAQAYAEIQLLPTPAGPYAIGEQVVTIVDHYYWSALPGRPSACELVVYAQMPGAAPEKIDHLLGTYCFVPGETRVEAGVDVAPGPCPPIVEAPLP